MPRGCAIALLAALSACGMLLVLIALLFIVVNERQVDLGRLAQASAVVRPDDPSAAPGALASLTGEVELEAAGLGDDLFLKPGGYLQVERVVEMYALEEYKAYEDSQGRPVYRRRQIWTRSTSGLGHVNNPTMAVKGATFTADAARIGEVRIDPRAADLPAELPLRLSKTDLLEGVDGTIFDSRLYVGAGTPARPEIGDLRISYTVVPSGQLVTIFGALEGDRLVPYGAADGRDVYPMFAGDRDSALRDLGAVEVIGGWLVRLLATAAIWFGLLLLFYGSRRLVAWPQALGITTSSVRLASALGLALAVLAIGSLRLAGGSLLALLAALGLGIVAAGGLLVWRRGRVAAGEPASA